MQSPDMGKDEATAQLLLKKHKVLFLFEASNHTFVMQYICDRPGVRFHPGPGSNF